MKKSLFILTVLMLTALGCGKSEDTGNIGPGSSGIDEPRVPSWLLEPYTKDQYPKMFAKYGAARIKEIEKLREKAGAMAIASGKCDYVEMMDLSADRSSRNHVIFYIDCRNGERIYLDETQIKGSGLVLTQKEKSWDETTALEACKSAIEDRALIPHDLKFHSLFGTSVKKSSISQVVSVRMDFDAKNAFGTSIPYTATCYFEPGKVGNIEINPRRN